MPTALAGRRTGVNKAMTDPCATTDDDAPTWRADVDALAFRPQGHGGVCMVHRHAFRTLLRSTPSPQDCATFYQAHRAVFEAAAHAKILRAAVAISANFHLTSRDISRQMAN
jgi:hypothetical protein